ncbi:hypothetical protein FNF27_00871 [Cafeteria roenbergensis]|uniref:Atg6 BARA domain-containing protein n=1 Tax=Cafeteria roenbergensis TaxID=33653 RepID=A0A5A8EJB6_CAFRO|nr:hypothetical protein FNF27_00871 [Cafeteria roenbergensis]
MTSRARVSGLSAPHKPVVRCQDMRCRLALSISDLPFDANRWVEDLFRTAPPGVDTARLLEECEGSVERSDAAAFVETVSAVAMPMSGVRLPLCDSCVGPAAVSRDRVLRQLRNTRSHLSALVKAAAASDDAAGGQATPGAATLPELHAVGEAAEASAEQEEVRTLTAAVLGARRRLAAARERREAAAKRRAAASRRRSALLRGLESARTSLGEELLDTRTFGQGASLSRAALEDLRCRRMLDEGFRIARTGPFATINGCRLGRTAREPVSWPEINAALGHTALLVATLIKHLDLVLSTHRIIPMGSFARICPHGGNERNAMVLHFDGGFFAQSRLNNALRGLAACVLEIQRSIADKLTLPFRISDSCETVGGLPLQLQLGTKEEEWTTAMRNLLTSLKWIQAWALAQ